MRFRKNSTAAKLYDGIQNGTYKGIKPPKKLYESDSYNAYRKNIQSGERVFLKFTTKPKPQMIYALKKRGWHWNALENAWSVPVGSMTPISSKGSRRTMRNTCSRVTEQQQKPAVDPNSMTTLELWLALRDELVAFCKQIDERYQLSRLNWFVEEDGFSNGYIRFKVAFDFFGDNEKQPETGEGGKYEGHQGSV